MNIGYLVDAFGGTESRVTVEQARRTIAEIWIGVIAAG